MRTLCGFPGEADPRQQEQDNESPSRMTDNADAELSAQNGWEAAAIECFQGRGLCTTSESCCLHELSKREDPSPKTMRWQERNGSYKTAFRVIEGKKNKQLRLSDPYHSEPDHYSTFCCTDHLHYHSSFLISILT